MTDGRAPEVSADAPLTLSTLGGASLSRANAIILSSGKPLALLTYLALTPGHSASREFLLDLLWADLDRERGRHALRQTLWQLRQLLGESAIGGREELTLGVVVETDRDQFLAAVERGDLDAAIRQYRGGFLPDFALPGSNEFEHWAEIERSRLRATFLRAAEMLVRRRLAAGRFREAQDLARRMRETDRLNETSWRLLLESLAAGRDHLQASIEADGLGQVLAADGREPEPATKALLAELKEAHGETATADERRGGGLVAELVGREREFSVLLDGWGRASKGPARLVHVSAPAGLGKTRLLTDLAYRLQSLGARFVYLRANPGDRRVPYAFAGDLAHALGPLPGLPAISPQAASALVGLSPSLSARFTGATPLRTVPELLRIRTAAITEAVTEIAAEHPMALLIDDVHWLDPESRQILEGLLHRLDRAPVLVVTAGRPGIGRGIEAAGTHRLELEPLDQTATRALVNSLGRVTDPALLDQLVDRLHRVTGGSPLLLIETLQLALERRRLLLDDGLWTCPEPAALLQEMDRGSALAARLSELDQDASWILLLLATAGTPLSNGEVASGTRARERLEEHLWALERKGLIRRVGESWEPAHDEIADAAVASEAVARQRSAHVTVGRILLGSVGHRVDTAIQACRHFAEGGNDAELAAAFRRLARLAGAEDDPRRHQALAEAAVSGTASPLTPEQLVKSLPWRVRFGLDRPMVRAVAAAGLLAGAAATIASFTNRLSGAEAELLLMRATADSTIVETTFAQVSGSQRESPVRAGTWTKAKDPAFARAMAVSIAPDGRIVFQSFVDNTRTDDIFLRDGDSSIVLAGGVRDDVFPVWSVGGDEVFFLTARWSAANADDYDIGAIDTRSGSIRQLTATPDFDTSVMPSPHGVLLAFTRAYRDLRLRQVCWMTVDGAATHCVESSIGEAHTVGGWLDARRVLLNVNLEPINRLVEWDIVTNEFKLLGTAGGFGRTSPDGRWVACYCQRDAQDPRRWMVFPSADPNAVRVVEGADSLQLATWAAGAARGPVKLTLRVDDPRIELQAGQTYLATARVTTNDLAAVSLPPGALRWAARDTTVAVLDSVSGRITGREGGQTVVVVSLAGAAVDSVAVTVTGPISTIAFREDWAKLDSTRWILFGTPFPRIVKAPGGTPAFNNNGDGSYSSGVISGHRFRIGEGFGMSVRLSAPITRSQWQTQGFSWVPDRTIPSTGWDRRTGGWKSVPDAEDETCGVGYPGREGVAGTGIVHLGAGGLTKRAAVDSTWRLGGWHQIDIQVFSDGTCAFRIDGMPVWRPESKLPLSQPYRLILQGNSVGSDIVVGPMEIWQGVKRDLNWSPAQRLP